MSRSDATSAPSFPAWVEVDLGVLAGNLEALVERANGSRIAAVLKADAYGHGAIAVARVLVKKGIELIVVARDAEAVELRRAGIEARILVLSPADEKSWPVIVEHGLEATCATPESLLFLRSVPAADVKVPVHVKVNTGMNRLGILAADARDVLEQLSSASGVRPVAICSHLADADLVSSPRTKEQAKRFQQVVVSLPSRYADLETHLANSAGLLHHPASDCSFVRLGLALYGYDPSAVHLLAPSMAVHARVLQVHQLKAGERVGYGGTWQAECPAQVAIVGVGYGDGYPYHQVGDARVVTERGFRPIVGSVSMDSLAFACTPEDPVRVGDMVTLLGARNGHCVTAHELAAHAETIPYEIVLRLGNRLPRVLVEPQ